MRGIVATPGCSLRPFFFPVICHLEGSGQWPQDAEAIRRVRAAFQLRLAELLTQQHGLRCHASAMHTDVLKVSLV